MLSCAKTLPFILLRHCLSSRCCRTNRVRFECGWVSETAADGRRILQPVPREQATSRYWPQLQVSRGLQLQSLWIIPTVAVG